MPEKMDFNLDALNISELRTSSSDILKRIRDGENAVKKSGRTPHKKQGKTGFALSGGGAKGSFQIGALRFLMEMRGIHPDVVSGTSVGAVNGAKLAEGNNKPAESPGYKPGLAGLVDIWHGLKKDEDMAEPIVEFQKLVGLLKGEISDIAVGLFGIGLMVGINPIVFAPFIGCLAEEISDSAEQIRKTVAEALYSGGIWSLNPVRAMIQDKNRFRPDLFRSSGIEMLICWVGMLSGKTFYVDNHKRLYVAPNFKSPVGTVDRLTDAIHASAAIPVIFKPPVVKGEWAGRRFAEVGFDGGVTEVAPVEILAARGVTQVFTIVCSPAEIPDLFTGVAGESENSMFKTVPQLELKNGLPSAVEKHLAELPALQFLLTIGTRALDISVGEILRDDLRAPDGQSTVIRPYVIVHETQQIDHDLIVINEDHGWMCAYDSEIPVQRPVQTQRGKMGLPNLARKFARDTNAAITLARRERCFAKRAVALLKTPGIRKLFGVKAASKLVDAYGTLAEKNAAAIREAVDARRKTLGLDSVPVLASAWDD